jgi:hypothetical protein
MIVISPKVKKSFELLIATLNVGVPLYFFLRAVMNGSREYESFQRWYPSHPVSTVLAYSIILAIELGVFFYLYKNKQGLGKLKTTGVVFSAYIGMVVFIFLMSSYRLLSS